MTTRTVIKLLVAFAIVTLWASAGSAATITFTGVNGLSDGVDFVGPYYLQINGSIFPAMCYDFAHFVAIGQVWEANLLGSQHLAASYYSDQWDYENNYLKVAWLFTQLLTPADSGAQIAIQHAAWSLFNPEPFREDLPAAAWRAAAQAAQEHGFSGLDFTTFRFLESPPGEIPVQGLVVGGFASENPQSAPGSGMGGSTPEPEALVMMGSGLLLLGLVHFRRR